MNRRLAARAGRPTGSACRASHTCHRILSNTLVIGALLGGWRGGAGLGAEFTVCKVQGSWVRDGVGARPIGGVGGCTIGGVTMSDDTAYLHAARDITTVLHRDCTQAGASAHIH